MAVKGQSQVRTSPDEANTDDEAGSRGAVTNRVQATSLLTVSRQGGGRVLERRDRRVGEGGGGGYSESTLET